MRDASEFNSAAIRAVIGQPKGGRIALTSWTLAQIFEARDSQLIGEFTLPARLAESIRTDDALAVALENRLAPQRSIPVKMKAAKGARSASVAAEAEALFGQCGVGISADTIASIHECLVNHEVAFGINTATTRDDGSRIDFEHHAWPIEFVRWDPVFRIFKARVDPATVSAAEAAKLINDSSSYGMLGTFEIPIVHGDGRWVIYQRYEIDPFKRASLLAAALVWARHAYAIRDWAKGSVAHGSAKVLGELPAGVPLQDSEGVMSKEAEAMADLLRSIASSDQPVGIRPSGSKVDFLVNSSSAWQVWKELVDNAEKAAARIYLGTDGTLGTTGNAPGVDVTQLLGVASTKVRSDLGAISRGINSGVIIPWTAVNFGDSTLAPEREYQLPDEEEEKRLASVGTRRAGFFADMKSTRENGFKLDQDYVDATAEEYGVTAPTLPEIDEDEPKAPTIQLAPTDLARVISVNEARASAGLLALMLPDGSAPDPDGSLTVEQFGIKKGAELAPPPPAPAAPPGA